MTTLYRKLTAVDRRVSRRLRLDTQSGGRWIAAVIFAHSGDTILWTVGTIVVLVCGGAIWRYRAAVILAGLIVQTVAVPLLKLTVRRKRPAGTWGGVYRRFDPHSFPSGHAARAGMLAIVTWLTGPVWLAVLVLAWAPVVSTARIATGVHYFSDVIAGLALGITIGVAVVLAEPWLSELLRPLLSF